MLFSVQLYLCKCILALQIKNTFVTKVLLLSLWDVRTVVHDVKYIMQMYLKMYISNGSIDSLE